MSPRPRTVTDEDILAATANAINRIGPVRLTLADVAKDVGLSPATLLQRFGSKRGLLLALVQLGVGSVQACFDAVRAAQKSPLAALMAAATEMTRHITSPEELANGLAFLQMDVSDPEFHQLALRQSRGLTEGYRALLDEAVAAGELAPCDTQALARAVSAISGGSLIGWAIHRQGSAEKWVRQDLETLVGPHRRGAAAATVARPSRRRRSPARARR
jgi:AcrR family transcriptional regulator